MSILVEKTCNFLVPFIIFYGAFSKNSSVIIVHREKKPVPTFANRNEKNIFYKKKKKTFHNETVYAGILKTLLLTAKFYLIIRFFSPMKMLMRQRRSRNREEKNPTKTLPDEKFIRKMETETLSNENYAPTKTI